MGIRQSQLVYFYVSSVFVTMNIFESLVWSIPSFVFCLGTHARLTSRKTSERYCDCALDYCLCSGLSHTLGRYKTGCEEASKSSGSSYQTTFIKSQWIPSSLSSLSLPPRLKTQPPPFPLTRRTTETATTATALLLE